jgi:hypothetical protein
LGSVSGQRCNAQSFLFSLHLLTEKIAPFPLMHLALSPGSFVDFAVIVALGVLLV